MMRPAYTTAEIRASDLADGDVIKPPQAIPEWWRMVLDVWADDDREYAESIYTGPQFAEERAIIARHLTGLGYYVIVRYLDESPTDADAEKPAEAASTLIAIRACDLVLIQVPHGTVPYGEFNRPEPEAPDTTQAGVFISRPELNEYTGITLTDEQVGQMQASVAHSPIPQMLSEIASSMFDPTEDSEDSGDKAAGNASSDLTVEPGNGLPTSGACPRCGEQVHLDPNVPGTYINAMNDGFCPDAASHGIPSRHNRRSFPDPVG